MIKEELGRLIDNFVTDEIALAQDDISDAVKSKEWLLNRIMAKIEERSWGPQLYASDPLIGYGSYFARVKVSDIDEMDFLLVIDSNSGVFNQGEPVGNGLGSAIPNRKYAPAFMKADGTGVSPNKLLFWLHDVCREVMESVGGETPLIDGPAVKVVLKSAGIKFDLVPAGVFEQINKPGSCFYNIPKGDFSDGWTITNPRKDIERVDRLASRHEGFRNIVRLTKLVRDSYELSLSSYAIQCAVCEYPEQHGWQSDMFSNLHNALYVLESRLQSGRIADGFNQSINLLGNVSNVLEIAEKVQAVRLQLVGLESETSDASASRKLWQILKNSIDSSARKAGLTSDIEALRRFLNPLAAKTNPWGKS